MSTPDPTDPFRNRQFSDAYNRDNRFLRCLALLFLIVAIALFASSCRSTATSTTPSGLPAAHHGTASADLFPDCASDWAANP